jgi:hypothetical protein
MQGPNFIFICGLHRSGTSVLHRIIRDHPDVTGFQDTGAPEDEGEHLQSVYYIAEDFGDAGKFAFHPKAHLTESSSLISDENKEKLMNEWTPYLDTTKRYIVEKSPPNLLRTRFLQALFPQSFFIIFLRHPIAVSIATHTWYKVYPWRIYTRRLYPILEHWVFSHEIFAKDSSSIKNYIVLHYEEFVKQPKKNIQIIFEFLGLSHQPIQQKILSNVNEKYFSRWDQLKNSVLASFITRPFTQKYENRVNQFGYSLIDLEMVSPEKNVLNIHSALNKFQQQEKDTKKERI